jgi:hypothetical protein
MDRALRRHHSRRIKALFYRYMKARIWEWAVTPGEAGVFANHGKACSCWMCGNPRRYLGEPTLQERRNSEAHLTQSYQYSFEDKDSTEL